MIATIGVLWLLLSGVQTQNWLQLIGKGVVIGGICSVVFLVAYGKTEGTQLIVKSVKVCSEGKSRRSYAQRYSGRKKSKKLNGERLKKHRVALEYWDFEDNLGDFLAPVIVEWMLAQKV